MTLAKRVGVPYRNPVKLEPYKKALEAAGVEPVPIDPDDPRSLDGLDGLLLTGGSDVNPELYGEPPDPATDAPDDARDTLERRLLESALARDLPVLAICRGMQLLNVALGGTLAQHVEGHRQPGVDEAHTITVEADAALARVIGAGAHVVNSRHHQIVDRVGRGLRVSASSGEGFPEALEMPDKKFALAVQWHPEDLLARGEDSRKLFEAFAKSC
jgi:putative glutamine amidotransferase